MPDMMSACDAKLFHLTSKHMQSHMDRCSASGRHLPGYLDHHGMSQTDAGKHRQMQRRSVVSTRILCSRGSARLYNAPHCIHFMYHFATSKSTNDQLHQKILSANPRNKKPTTVPSHTQIPKQTMAGRADNSSRRGCLTSHITSSVALQTHIQGRRTHNHVPIFVQQHLVSRARVQEPKLGHLGYWILHHVTHVTPHSAQKKRKYRKILYLSPSIQREAMHHTKLPRMFQHTTKCCRMVHHNMCASCHTYITDVSKTALKDLLSSKLSIPSIFHVIVC